MILQDKLQNALQINSEACSRIVAQKVAQTYVHFYDAFMFLRLFI